MTGETEPNTTNENGGGMGHSLIQLYENYRRAILIFLPALGLILVTLLLPRPLLLAIWNDLAAHRVILFLLLGFSLVTLSLLFQAGQRLDAGLFLYFNLHKKFSSRFLDAIMWLVTQIGSGGFGIALAVGLYLLGYRVLAAEMGIGILTLWLFVELIKALTDRTRPFIALGQVRVVGWRARGRSFPSGHTSQAFFLMSILGHGFQLPPLGVLALFGVALIVGFTRIYVGAHYPRDVIGGAILGSIWGLMAALSDAYLSTRF